MQRLHLWSQGNLRGRKGQRGFTLIELLVVVTILGILAGIVTLSLVGLTTRSNTQACNTEYKVVQAALDAYMAANNYSTLPGGAQTHYTNDMTGAGGATGGNVPLFNSNPSQSQPNYTRNGTTQFYYEWDQFGKITDPAGGAGGNGIGSNGGGASITGCQPK